MTDEVWRRALEVKDRARDLNGDAILIQQYGRVGLKIELAVRGDEKGEQLERSALKLYGLEVSYTGSHRFGGSNRVSPTTIVSFLPIVMSLGVSRSLRGKGDC